MQGEINFYQDVRLFDCSFHLSSLFPILITTSKFASKPNRSSSLHASLYVKSNWIAGFLIQRCQATSGRTRTTLTNNLQVNETKQRFMEPCMPRLPIISPYILQYQLAPQLCTRPVAKKLTHPYPIRGYTRTRPIPMVSQALYMSLKYYINSQNIVKTTMAV